MTRPAISPRNIRRNQPAYKIRRNIGNWIAATAATIAAAIVFVHVFDPALNPFI